MLILCSKLKIFPNFTKKNVMLKLWHYFNVFMYTDINKLTKTNNFVLL